MSKYKIVLTFTLIISFLFVLNAYAQTDIKLNSDIDYNEERYLQLWHYTGEGIPVPFTQTIVASVGYECDAYLSRIHVTRSFLTGIALMGAHMPFEETVFLIHIKWYIDDSLYDTITSFEYPPVIADPDDIGEYGEDYSTFDEYGEDYSTFDIYLDSDWDQEGMIEVYADETLEMWRLYTVVN